MLARHPGECRDTVLQVSDPTCRFTDLACPEPAVLRVQWIPAFAGMAITPVRVRI
jgi:hypothetical protein